VGRKFVAYYRANDGLDLHEQAEYVEGLARGEGGEVIKTYRDDEAGGPPGRPALARALAYARRNDASLLVATLWGLSRDLPFLRALRDARVDFVACDLPPVNASTIQVLTALAEYDARVASARSKRALDAYRARGGKLGGARPEGRNLDARARAKGARTAGASARALADAAYREIAPTIRRLREDGLSLREIAGRLNDAGQTTRRGRRWSAIQVSRVLGRYREGRG
jgi:DNA invertase Pin-like site-specific DNA recombinase